MDNLIFSVTDYYGPNLWSTELHDAFPDIDGLYFISRLANQPSVAIFEDRVKLVPAGQPIPLNAHPELSEFLAKAGIEIAPDGSCFE